MKWVPICLLTLLETLFINIGNSAPKRSHTLCKDSISHVLYFKFNSATLDSAYMSNASTLREMKKLLLDTLILQQIDSVVITGRASFDGNADYNKTLSNKRAKSIHTYIRNNYNLLPDKKVILKYVGEDWDSFRRYAENDSKLPNKEKVVQVIDMNLNLETKEWRIRRIGAGESWRYILNNYMKQLRNGSTVFFYYSGSDGSDGDVGDDVSTSAGAGVNSAKICDCTADADAGAVGVGADADTVGVANNIIQIDAKENYIKQPLFAVKTNLLYDVMSALNFEIEVPLSKKISLQGEIVTPWWKSSKNKFTFQLIMGNGTVKYWLGDRNAHEILTGWSIGITGGGGKYDFQIFNKDGVQGSFYNAGVTAGYAHKICKNFRLEYSLGVGYINSKYTKYTQEEDIYLGNIKAVDYPYNKHKLNWFGPLSAKISLVWLINCKKKK